VKIVSLCTQDVPNTLGPSDDQSQTRTEMRKECDGAIINTEEG
jgi:hypothetical protein